MLTLFFYIIKPAKRGEGDNINPQSFAWAKLWKRHICQSCLKSGLVDVPRVLARGFLFDNFLIWHIFNHMDKEIQNEPVRINPARKASLNDTGGYAKHCRRVSGRPARHRLCRRRRGRGTAFQPDLNGHVAQG